MVVFYGSVITNWYVKRRSLGRPIYYHIREFNGSKKLHILTYAFVFNS